MGRILSPDGHLTERLPASSPKFSVNEVEIAIGGLGGDIEAVEFDWDGESVTVYHRTNAPLPGVFNGAAAQIFAPDFHGKVLIASDSERPHE